MRTSTKQPRKGSGGGKSAGGGSRGGSGGGSAKGKTLGGVLRGVSAQMNVADMTKWAADRAADGARKAAEAAGASATQIRTAARRARAEAIRDTAQRAGVSPVTARRWARGAQKPSAGVEKSARTRVQRALGGARALRAARVAELRSMAPGNVTVRIKSGPYAGSVEQRHIGMMRLDASTTASVAALIEEGADDEAAELLGDALLDAYGNGNDMSHFMEIVSINDVTSWL
ncbi:hypothetical protein [Nocardioides sp. NPDC006273]|uniref:hypothetical protein n=1 Tax=Nocardioides sp. NPDC006273 TaxID=3155598 RepID=UPI0033AA1E06